MSGVCFRIMVSKTPTDENQISQWKTPLKASLFKVNWHVQPSLNFPRSVNPSALSGIAHGTDTPLQLKDNQELSYYQEQLWSERIGIFVGQLLH